MLSNWEKFFSIGKATDTGAEDEFHKNGVKIQRHYIAVMIVERVGKALFRLDIEVYKEDYVHLDFSPK